MGRAAGAEPGRQDLGGLQKRAEMEGEDGGAKAGAGGEILRRETGVADEVFEKG
jgi:hypothetical protein